MLDAQRGWGRRLEQPRDQGVDRGVLLEHHVAKVLEQLDRVFVKARAAPPQQACGQQHRACAQGRADFADGNVQPRGQNLLDVRPRRRPTRPQGLFHPVDRRHHHGQGQQVALDGRQAQRVAEQVHVDEQRSVARGLVGLQGFEPLLHQGQHLGRFGLATAQPQDPPGVGVHVGQAAAGPALFHASEQHPGRPDGALAHVIVAVTGLGGHGSTSCQHPSRGWRQILSDW